MNIELTENRGKHLDFVNKTLSSMGIPPTREDNNENVAVLKDTAANKIIAVIGFNSDAGTNHYTELTQHHEILYMEEFTSISSNEKYTDEIKRLTSLWLLNYLTRSAVSSSSPMGGTPKAVHFDVGINVHLDNHNILQDSFQLISDTFSIVTTSLGYN